MFCDVIIHGIPELIKYFQQLKLDFYFSKPQIKHIQAFIVSMMFYGYCGKLSNVSDNALHACRTSIGRFLDSNSWNEAYLLRQMQQHVIKQIWEKSKQTRLPIYVIVDDTICEKTVPSTKAKQPIAGCGFHQSHLNHKTVYGHQFVTVMLQCGDLVLPYDTVLYEKEKDSKIQIAKRVITTLPKPVHTGYVLADSWYSCQEIFEASLKVGYHFIGAIKSNRKIFPRGFRKKGIQVGEFARSLKLHELDLVTIKGNDYYTYTYLGKINGMHKVKIVISWPAKAVFVPRAMKVFISTDFEMSGKQLLNHYTNRWPIEVFFREGNRRLGMKQCQAHSLKAVIRYQYIVMLCYIFCGLEFQEGVLGFSKQRHSYEKRIKIQQLSWFYSQTQNNADFNSLLRAFHLA